MALAKGESKWSYCWQTKISIKNRTVQGTSNDSKNTSYRNDTKCDASKDQDEEKEGNKVYIEHKTALLAHVRHNIISQ